MGGSAGGCATPSIRDRAGVVQVHRPPLVVPSPTWPYSLWPQVHTWPSDLIATEKARPPAIAVIFIPDRFWTASGVKLSVKPLLPNCPQLFEPQAQTVPSDLMARECHRPWAMAVTFERPATGMGVES